MMLRTNGSVELSAVSADCSQNQCCGLILVYTGAMGKEERWVFMPKGTN